MKEDKLADSLIFNIIKKIELRMAMEEKYEVTRAPQLNIIHNQLGRHLHSTLAMGYFGIAMSSIIYLRFKRKNSIKQRQSNAFYQIDITACYNSHLHQLIRKVSKYYEYRALTSQLVQILPKKYENYYQ
jgi:hypothetical protein